MPVLPVSPIFLPLLLLLAFAGGCSEGPPPVDESDASDLSGEEEPMAGSSQVLYERHFAFIADDPDSLAILPWLFERWVGPESTRQRARSWVLLDSNWDTLLEDERELGTTRAPWRILPGGPIGLTVGPDDALESLFIRNGGGGVELAFLETVTEWSGTAGEVFRVGRGRASLATGSGEGFVLELNRARRNVERPRGDWKFLRSEDGTLKVFLDGVHEADDDVYPARAWTRMDGVDTHWPDVEVRATDLRPFERARRDVPAGWSFATPAEELVGELEAESVHLMALEGEGPILPVEGLFQVHGHVRKNGDEIPVFGFIMHARR